MLDQPYMTDLIEANSMGHEPHKIDIYSASWGPTDDGKTVDGPRNATMRAIVQGVNEGRRGLGNIYVWASGDGGEEDDCNCDGYAASMWTISINSAINDGQNAHYDESCSSTLASTFSNGAKDPNTGVVSGRKRRKMTNYEMINCFVGDNGFVWQVYDNSLWHVGSRTRSCWRFCFGTRGEVRKFFLS
jgi:hypothetical protein